MCPAQVSKNGVTREVGPGDVVIIPPNTPHFFSQIDSEVTYMIFRVDTHHIWDYVQIQSAASVTIETAEKPAESHSTGRVDKPCAILKDVDRYHEVPMKPELESRLTAGAALLVLIVLVAVAIQPLNVRAADAHISRSIIGAFQQAGYGA